MEADINLANKQIEIDQVALDRTVIRSPMNGIVLKRFVEPGAKRMAGMLVQIVQAHEKQFGEIKAD